METYKRVTLAKAAAAELEEKRSLFIGYAAPVSSEEEARELIKKRREEFSDATHNVWAYYINGGIHARYSDDGEPQGTAGIPVLNVLKMSGATDMCAVVTRYFGGTLLGAGGLVRAYSAAAKLALDAAGIAVMEDFTQFCATVSYADYQRLSVQLPKIGAVIDNTAFNENISVYCAIETRRKEEIPLLIRELTGGKGATVELGTEERPAQMSD